MLRNSQLQETHYDRNVISTGYCITGMIFYIIMQNLFPFNTTDVSNEELLNVRLQEGHAI